MLLERFKIMWPEGQILDLQTIMNLKDMKRNEQNKLIELFGGSVGVSSIGTNSHASGIGNITSIFQSTSVASLTQGFSSSFGRSA